MKGAEGMTVGEVVADVGRGGKFVRYDYVVSILILTFWRSSDVIYVPAGKSRFVPGLPYTALTLLVGWWGFPFGLIFTPIAALKNLGGGTDHTQAVLSAITSGQR